MSEWAKYKGINVLATGDFTHPFWFEQLKNELEDTGNGLYQLKRHETWDKGQDIYFLLSCEISSIYSQGGQTRRVHNLFFFPSLKSVEKFNELLRKRGANLRSDGRPIVGITSRDLAQIALDVDDKALIIPAHAWTPWFSVFGSFSGFDSIEECFGDMAPYIYGIETGLSSDPAMNWQVGDLDNRAILSFSDAHSLEKMGREATVFEAGEISYEAIYEAVKSESTKELKSKSGMDSNTLALKNSNSPKIAFTIEFYPEEGKYHFTGHRDCNVSLSPAETRQKGETCPVCGKALTVGVMHRVEELTTKNAKQETRNVDGVRWVYPQGTSRPPFVSLVPLYEIIAESIGVAPKTKKVADCYNLLVNNFENELSVLLKINTSDLSRFAPAKVVDGIKKVREGNIKIEPGYDGKFGEVKIWEEENSNERENQPESQLNLFAG